MYSTPLRTFTIDGIEYVLDDFWIDFIFLPLPCGTHELGLWEDQ